MIVTSGRAHLAVDAVGDGSGLPALLVHAGVTDRRSWGPVVALVKSQRRCLSYDARGFGETTYAPEPFSPVDDAIAVLDAAGVESAAVVGCSLGGRTALDLALAHSGRVAALVLIAPGISGAPDLDEYPDAVNRLVDALHAAEESGDLAEVNRLEAWLWLDGAESREGRVAGEERALFLDMNAIALAAADPGDEVALPAAWPRLEEVGCPTLLVVGNLDLPDLRQNCRDAAKRIPGGEFLEVTGAAHLPHFESPVACRESISGFLARCDPP